MTIYFHEGLPGAGKSYEACVMHILPAITRMRKVVTNIEGICYETFSELTGLPVTTVQDLIINIELEAETDEGIAKCKKELISSTPDNALVVWDEIQDYFPSDRSKLPPDHQKFVTEHRHRGLDIILMGQDRDDVHRIWRNRIQTVVYFLKLEAVGRPNSYKWEYWQKQRKNKFVKTSSGVRPYDSKYFGLYASHQNKDVHTDLYTTKNTNMLAKKSYKWFAFLLILSLVWAGNYLYGFFTGANSIVKNQPAQNSQVKLQDKPVIVSSDKPVVFDKPKAAEKPQQKPQKEEEEAPPLDYFDELARSNKLRMPAVIRSDDGRFYATVHVLNSSYHVQESFNNNELASMGWDVSLTDYGLLIAKGDTVYLARSWPIDKFGTVDNHTTQQL